MAQFEKLIVWQKAQEFAIAIDTAARQLKYDAASQIKRAAASITDNVAEGSQRGSDPQFAHFLSIALGSCAEAQSQLRRAHACGYLERPVFIALIDQSQQVGWMLAALRRRMAT